MDYARTISLKGINKEVTWGGNNVLTPLNAAALNKSVLSDPIVLNMNSIENTKHVVLNKSIWREKDWASRKSHTTSGSTST